jgi:hypothetical protein
MSSGLTTQELQTVVNFYAREGLYRHIQVLCSDSLKKRGDDPVLLFWRAFGILFEGMPLLITLNHSLHIIPLT